MIAIVRHSASFLLAEHSATVVGGPQSPIMEPTMPHSRLAKMRGSVRETVTSAAPLLLRNWMENSVMRYVCKWSKTDGQACAVPASFNPGY